MSELKNRENTRVLLLIALFKLVKGLALVAVGIGALHLLHGDVEESVMRCVNVLRVDPDSRFIHGIVSRVFQISPTQLRELSIGTFLYAGLFLT